MFDELHLRLTHFKCQIVVESYAVAADLKAFATVKVFVFSCLVEVFALFHLVSSSAQQRPTLGPQRGRDAFLTLHFDLKGRR